MTDPITDPKPPHNSGPQHEALAKQVETWQRKVQLGWIAGVMSALVSTINLVRFQPDDSNIVLWASVDILIVATLSLGVYKRLAWAGIALFSYFVADIALIFLAGSLDNSLFSLLYGYFYFQAMLALMALSKTTRPPQ